MSKKPNFDFGFKDPGKVASLFAVTDPESINLHEVKNIQIAKLKSFTNHPFKLYEGQRMDDMCESVKENGVLMPIIVRPIDDGNYEILSGHNRTEAAKLMGLELIPAIIREDLTDEEAMLIVTETNLIQRSFADLSHSERAVTLTMRHEAVKGQGKRTDLIIDIENLLKNDRNASENGDNRTFSQLGKKLNNVVKLGGDYGLSKNSVARYLRINKLIDPLKNRLDNGDFGIVPAVDISYLSDEEQENLNNLLENSDYKLDMKKAAQLRESSEKKALNANNIEEIFTGIAKKKNNSSKVQKITLKSKTVSRFFSPEDKPDEIEAEIIEALEFYRAHKEASESEN